MGLENHWGLLARLPERQCAADSTRPSRSPWFGVTLDMGNFRDNVYESLELSRAVATHVHAKTYYGGGIWYEIDLDNDRIAKMLKKHNYRGRISLEFEGKEAAKTAVPRSLAVLRKAFNAA